MIRVLQMMGGLNRGGLETFVMNIYRAIDRDLIQFDFLVNSRGDYAEEIEELGGRIFLTPARNSGYRSSHNGVDDFFREHASEYAACHLHISSLSYIKGLEAAKKWGIPVRVMHGHSSSISKSLKYYYIHELLHYLHKPKVKKVATHYFGCSDKSLDWLYDYTGVRDKAILIKNGISVDDYVYNQEINYQVREELGIKGSSLVLGHVGRFIPLKNHSFLIEVFKEVHNLIPDSRLLLIGDGETRTEIENMVEQYGLKGDVLFLGVRGDVNRLLQTVDCLVMPSLFEGLPVSLVEAQAAGSLVVASDTISKDSKLTDFFIFASLSDDAKRWANIIVENTRHKLRPNNSLQIKKSGFDSKSTACLLTRVYLGDN